MCLVTSLSGGRGPRRGKTSKSLNVKKSETGVPGHGTPPSRTLGTYGAPGTGPFPTRRAGDGPRCRGGFHLTQVIGRGSFFDRPKIPQSYCAKEVGHIVFGSESAEYHVSDRKLVTGRAGGGSIAPPVGVGPIAGSRDRPPGSHPELAGDGRESDGIRRRVVGGGKNVVESAVGGWPKPYLSQAPHGTT